MESFIFIPWKIDRNEKFLKKKPCAFIAPDSSFIFEKNSKPLKKFENSHVVSHFVLDGFGGFKEPNRYIHFFINLTDAPLKILQLSARLFVSIPQDVCRLIFFTFLRATLCTPNWLIWFSDGLIFRKIQVLRTRLFCIIDNGLVYLVN